MSDPKQAALDRVLAAIAALGEAAPAAIAEHAGMGYSTTTPKLRTLQTTGLAERVTDSTGKTVWKLTATGALAAAVTTGNTDTSAAAETDTVDDIGDDVMAEGSTTDNAVAGDAEQDGPAPQPRAVVSASHSPDTDDAPPAGEQPPTAAPDDDLDGRTASDGEQPVAEEPAPDITTEAAGPGTATETAGQVDEAGQADAAGPAADAAVSSKPLRRSGGRLREAVLKVLQDSPGERFKVGQLCKRVDAANAGIDAAKASPGAVHNALDKLVGDGIAERVVERPATYQLHR